MTKLVLFDFDGVIINEYTEHYRLSQKQIRGITEEEFRGLFDGNVHAEREKLKLRDTGFDIKTAFSNHKSTVIIDSKIKTILQRLSKKYMLGIVTSSKEKGVNLLLLKNGLEGSFLFSYGFETHPSKVEKLYRALRKYDVEPNECVFVTDTVGDILEARKVGIESIAVDFGYHERDRLQKVNPVEIVSSFSDIEKAIENVSAKRN